MASENEITIPERHVEFCRAVARLCEEYELRRFRGNFEPGWDQGWIEPIEISWEAGRHYDSVERVHISSTKRISTTTTPQPDEGGERDEG